MTEPEPVPARSLRITKLDAAGNPVGEPIEVRADDAELVSDLNHWTRHTVECSGTVEFGPASLELADLLYGPLPEPTRGELLAALHAALREPYREQVWAQLTPYQRTQRDGVDRFTNSELSTFKDCPRRWYLTYVRRLQRRVEDPTGVRQIGDRIHRALERWYVPEGEERTDPRDALEQLLSADLAALTAAAARAGRDQIDPTVLAEYRREADLQRIMVAGYVEWIAETGADSDLLVVEPEAYLEAPLPEAEALLVARIDVRVRRASDDLRLWLEHKTVASFTQKLAGIQLDEQVLFQTLVETLQPGEQPRVVGVLYNLLRRVKRGPTAKPPFYRREEIRHNRHEIASFRRRTVATIANLRQARERLSAGADHLDVAYPRPSGDCSWKCPFFQICPLYDDGSRVESAERDLYAVGDPTSYYLKTGVID